LFLNRFLRREERGERKEEREERKEFAFLEINVRFLKNEVKRNFEELHG